jgi:glycosyltransferase involved in cell wall biosynthesis
VSRRLLYDLTAVQTNERIKFDGGSAYASILFNKIIENGLIDFECVYNPNFPLDGKIKKTCITNEIKLNEAKTIKQIKSLIENKGYKKFYSAMPYNYVDFNYKQTELIFTIHGLRFMEMPYDNTEIFYYPGVLRKIKYLLKRLLLRRQRFKIHKQKFDNLFDLENKKIIVVSEHTKYSLLSFYPHLKSDIIVCHSPIDFKKFYAINERKQNYFLLISGNRWIKNNYRAIKAFDELFSRGFLEDKEVTVLGVGNVDFSRYVSNKKKFHFSDYVDYDTLEKKFNDAFCFVYPSLNEGFGYPPIQAMKYGTPVIASAISAIPEVCQNAVCYFNPFSIKELQNRILQVSSNNNYYDTLRRRGFKRIIELKKVQERMFQNLIEFIF